MKKIIDIKLLKDYIPLLYIFLVCLGYFSNSIYWSVFDIDIIYYINVIELLFYFIPLGAAIAGMLLIVFIPLSPAMIARDKGILLDFTPEENRNEQDDSENSEEPDSSFWRRTKLIIRVIIEVIPTILIIYTLCTILFVKLDFNFNLFKITLLIWVFLLYFYFGTISDNYSLTEKPRLIFLIGLVLIIIYYISSLNRKFESANDLLDGKPTHHIRLIKGNDTIKSSKDFIYLGQTNDYFFLRKLKNDENHIFKKSDLSEIALKKINIIQD